jgi:hypothetical protein
MLQALVGGLFMLVVATWVYALVRGFSGSLGPDGQAIDDGQLPPDINTAAGYYAASANYGGDTGYGGGGGSSSGDGGGGGGDGGGGGGSW